MTKLLRNTSIPEAPCSNLNFLLKVAVALEKAAQSDEYFVKRKLYPNVDFYTGFIYRAMGFPTMFFPVLFAIPRVLPTSGGLFGEVPQGYFKASCPASIPDTYYCLHFLYDAKHVVEILGCKSQSMITFEHLILAILLWLVLERMKQGNGT